MNAVELFNANGNPAGVWVCGKCRKLAVGWWSSEPGELPKNTREAAEACCTDPPCEKCGKPTTAADNRGYRNLQCRGCRDDQWKRDRELRTACLLAKAEDVTATYDGPVSLENSFGGDMGEGYYSSVEMLADYVEDDLDGEHHDDDGNRIVPVERWAFACESEVKQFDLDNCLENLCSDGYEGMYDHLTIPQSLKDAVDEFNKINERALTCWETDYSRKVRVR